MSLKSETAILFPAKKTEDGPDHSPALPAASTRPPSGVHRRGPRSRAPLDWSRLVLAGILGLVTWFVIDFTRMEEPTVTATLTVTAPAKWQLARPTLQNVRVTLRGPRQAMQNVQRNIIRLDLAIPPELAVDGELALPLRDGKLSGTPDSVELLRVNPETLVVALARNETQQLEVEVVTTGAPAEGYAASVVTSEPARVAVTGPQEEVVRMAMAGEKVQTEPLDLSGKSRTESRSVRLKPLVSSTGAPLTLDRSSVFVTIEMEEAPVTREIAGVPVRLLMSARDAFSDDFRQERLRRWVTPAEVTVTVTGQRLLVNSLTPEQLVVYVTPAGLTPDPASPGAYKARVQALKPELGTIVKIDPDEVGWKP